MIDPVEEGTWSYREYRDAWAASDRPTRRSIAAVLRRGITHPDPRLRPLTAARARFVGRIVAFLAIGTVLNSVLAWLTLGRALVVGPLVCGGMAALLVPRARRTERLNSSRSSV